MNERNNKSLKSVEASTGIEPVYTDLQSAASPLRQLAAVVWASDTVSEAPAQEVSCAFGALCAGDVGSERKGRSEGPLA